jgi:hypothetical protein
MILLRKHGGKIILASLMATALVYGCGKKKKSSDSSDDSQLAAAYPLGLNIAIYPQTNSTSFALTDDLEQSVKAKNEEAAKRIRGEADCFPAALGKAGPQMGEDKCYEFDSEMIYLTQGGSYVNGTKDGKSKKDGSSEACMVSFARGKIKQITGMVDRTLGMVQMMICQARKSGAAGAPGSEGESVDFKAIMDAAATAAGKDPSRMPVSAASMTLSSGKYVTEIAMKMPTAPNSPPTDSDPVEKITLTHNPSSSDENAYTGTIVIRRTKDFDQSATKERILTINYERSNGRVKYKLLTAAVNTDISANAVVDGILNLNVSTNSSGAYVRSNGTPFNNQNDAVSGIMMIGFDMNPDNNDGNFSYWVNPGAGYTEKPRGFVANVTANATTGLMAGCSSSGAFSGGSIRKSIKESLAIKPDGSYHPFACHSGQQPPSAGVCLVQADGSESYYQGTRNGQTQNMYRPVVSDATAAQTWTRDQMTAYVARQCFTQDSTGVYNIDTTNTPDTAGYQLLQSNSPSLPTPPDLGSIQ